MLCLLPIDQSFDPIQDGGRGWQKASFSAVNSRNVRISPKNFLTFSFNPFAALE